MSETENIGKMAELVSEKLLSFFKWEITGPYNTNFSCIKPADHSTKEKHTHPVDVVFHYLDPYTGKRVFLNTDLKSYSSGSLQITKVRDALKSLAKTIDCANLSGQWNERFTAPFSGPKEIRGLLFTYNHTGDFDRDFYNRFFYKKSTDKKQIIDPYALPVKKNQLLHIVEPLQIVYLNTLMMDLQELVVKRQFPMFDEGKHFFFYPELYLHKTHFNKYERAASIELLSAPFLIIGHDEIFNSKGELASAPGFVIYYNGIGEAVDEFVYLLDTLSKNQILDSSAVIKIRCTNFERSPDIRARFAAAISKYAGDWAFDDHKFARLAEIEKNFETVTQVKELLTDIDVGWRLPK